MAMTTGDSFTQFERLLLEAVDPSIHNLHLEEPVDPLWDLLQTFPAIEEGGKTTNRAGSSNEGDAGYEASWEIMIQRGGRFSGGSMSGNTNTIGGLDNTLTLGTTTLATYLDPLKTPMRSNIEVKMALKRLRGSIVCNRTQIHKKILSKGVGVVATDETEDAVFQLRKLVSSCCYSQKGRVAQFYDGTDVTETPAWFSVVGGTIYRFVVGQRYVAAADDGDGTHTPRTGTVSTPLPGIFRCVGLDPDEDKVAFQAETGEGTISITANDWIFQEGMYDFTDGSEVDLAPNGIDSLLIKTGTYPGTGWNVANQTVLKSFIDDNTASYENPTPELLADMADKMERAGFAAPPVWIGPPTVWTFYSQLERANGAVYMVPQGASFQASGQVTAPRIGHGERTYVRLSSSLIAPNTVNGIDPSTFKRFMPLGGNTIRWAMQQGGVAGISGIFRPCFSTNSLTDLSVADCDVYFQLGQTNPRRCCRILGVHDRASAGAA